MVAAAAATAVLPLRATAVAMKTPVATAMAGHSQTKINNQLNAVTARETAARQQRQRGRGSTAVVVVASLAAEVAAWQERSIGGGPSQINMVNGTVGAHPPA